MSATYKTIDIDTIDYKNEITINKNNGAKNVYVSTQKGSNAMEHRLRFQMGVYGSEVMRAVYGVSTPLNGQDERRRALDLSIDSDELLTFLTRLDDNNKAAALKNAQEWFKKPLTAAEVEAFYVPIVKPSNKPDMYRPTARTKLIIDSERNNSQLFMVTKESSGSAGRIEKYEPATINDIQKGCKTIPIVETSGLWFAQKSFGMSLVVSHLLVWPARQVRGIEAFMLPGDAPQLAPSMCSGIGAFDAEVEEEMMM